MDLIGDLPPPRGQIRIAASLHRLRGAIEGNPGHDLRMGKMPPGAAHLPDPFVGFAPNRGEIFEHKLAQVVNALGHRQAPACGLEQCIGNLAVNIELKLRGGCIPDPNRPLVFIAGEPGKFRLR